MDFEEARIRLGLEPFDTFKPKNHDHIKYFTDPDPYRRTGRTTRMLLGGVVESQYRPVAFKGYSDHYTRTLRRQAQEMAYQLGLDPERIVTPNHKYTDQIYYDHYRGRDAYR